jgi:hypothetical protein
MLKLIDNKIGYSFNSKAKLFEHLIKQDLSLDLEKSKPKFNLFYATRGLKKLAEIEVKNIEITPSKEDKFEFNKGKGYKVIKLNAIKKRANSLVLRVPSFLKAK